MKYLYKILRLFFCPHKYKLVSEKGIIKSSSQKQIGSLRIKECQYCGKEKGYKENNYSTEY
jgi:hypothetical protein